MHGVNRLPDHLRADRKEILMALRSISSWLAVLCVGGAIATHADTGERLEVDIRLRVDPSLASRHITERLKTETEAIWQPYGVWLKWIDADVSDSAATGVPVDVSVERRELIESPLVLGRTDVNRDAPAWRPIRVSFDATERLLADRATARVSEAAVVLDRELARALGRVLAHEIGHVLLGPPYHDRAGLMRATFRADELAAADRTRFRLTCGGVVRLRGRVRALHGDLPVEQHDSTALAIEGVRATRRGSAVEGSCIRTQPAH